MNTVVVKTLENQSPHLLMTWNTKPEDEDVLDAFTRIREHINRVRQQVCIIVDITASPNYNLRLTFAEALQIQKLPYPPCWLMVGKNHLSAYIARLLEAMGRAHIEWFNTYDEAVSFIEERERTR